MPNKYFIGEEGTLPLVSSVAEIQRNAETLGDYLQKPNSPEGRYAKERIRMGKCFVIVSSANGYCFYPSRFMGYVDNSMEAHERMGELKKKTGRPTKDGRKTNPTITAVLCEELIEERNEQWDRWETEYKKFCNELGVVPDNVARKYWPPITQKN
jgi:hypothetical protein